MFLKFAKFGLLISVVLLFTNCSPSYLAVSDDNQTYEYQTLCFEDMLDETYRFEMNFKLLFKNRTAQGMMSSSIQEDTLYVQYFSDFGKNLLIFKRDIKHQESKWELVYTLPEMNYDGLHTWFKEDLEVLFAKYFISEYKIDKKQEYVQYLKRYNSAQNIVYLQNPDDKKFNKAFLIDKKKKIIKNFDIDRSENTINIQYKTKKVTIKYKKLDATR